MKKILMTTLLMTAIFTGLHAQSGKSKLSEQQKKELKAKMDEYRARLNLSEEQSEKVETINMDFYESLSGIRTEGGGKLQKYKKFKQASREKDKKMKDVLTPDQYKIYQQQQEEFREEIRSRRTNQ